MILNALLVKQWQSEDVIIARQHNLPMVLFHNKEPATCVKLNSREYQIQLFSHHTEKVSGITYVKNVDVSHLFTSCHVKHGVMP